ncbi:MAG TPA: ATP-binding protein, partial [Bryobacteraceae bacterium]|nr:ATP-binding protein [Bryobacteraceae bacterium]
QACALSAKSLSTNTRDLPFALIYLYSQDHRQITLAGLSGIVPGHPAAPPEAAVHHNSSWPFEQASRASAPLLIEPLDSFLGLLPSGPWDRPPFQAVAVPIAPSGTTGRSGLLIAGLNPFRRYDDSYDGFLQMVAGHISAAIANAQAYEEERKRAESLAELDRAKTTFFSNVSHEFRTPLTLMLGTLEELLAKNGGDLIDGGRPLLEVAHRNGLHVLKVVNTLVDFSRIEAGRVQASYQVTDLDRFTEELASVFRSAMDKARLRFRVECAALPEKVYVDHDMWEKIVLNLLSNAYKFTFEGEVRVSLRPSPDGRAAELEVTDTGTGIPEDELPRLFERFHRVEGARGRTHEGTGIGLALVQELVKLHGGTITVESRAGKGSAFLVRIPFGCAHLSENHINAKSEAPEPNRARAYVEEALRWLPDADIAPAILAAPGTLSSDTPVYPQTADAVRSRILLADDNADMREYLRRLLAPFYDVEAVANGAEAFARAQTQPPDLVLTDAMMPELDGFRLLEKLRSRPETAGAPVILLSARA